MSSRGASFIAALLVMSFVLLPTAVRGQESTLDELFKDMPSQATKNPKAGSADADQEAGKAGSSAGEKEVSSSNSPRSAATWELSGEQLSVYHLPILRDPIDYSGLYLKPRVENNFRLVVQPRGVKLVSGWRVDLWPLGAPLGGGSGEALSAGPADITIVPEDNYVEMGSSPVRVRAGYFVDAWGAADGLNPTNNVNPVDYTEGLDPVSIPSFLLQIVYYPLPTLSVELVFEPYKRDDLFPVSPAASIPTSLFTASEITVSDPAHDLASTVYGVKASLYTSAVDLSLDYLSDIDPYYTPKVTYVSYLDKSVDLERTRIHRIGADAKTTLGPFGLWLEACLSLTEDPRMTSTSIRNPSLAWTAGTDVSYGPGGAFYLNLQYSGRYIFGYDRSFYSDYPGGLPDPTLLATDPSYATEYYQRALSQPLGDQNEGFLSGIIAKLDFPFANGKWKPTLAAAYYLPLIYDTSQEIRYGSLLLQPGIAFKPVDTMTFTLGAELMYAWKKEEGSNVVVVDTADRIGMWNDQSNIFVKASVSW